MTAPQSLPRDATATRAADRATMAPTVQASWGLVAVDRGAVAGRDPSVCLAGRVEPVQRFTEVASLGRLRLGLAHDGDFNVA